MHQPVQRQRAKSPGWFNGPDLSTSYMRACMRRQSRRRLRSFGHLASAGSSTKLSSSRKVDARGLAQCPRQVFKRGAGADAVAHHSRYFSRTWAIQEVALAQRLTLHANDFSIFLSKDKLDRIYGVANRLNVNLPVPFQALSTVNETRSVVQYLVQSLDSICSDPRDHVYAILSMLPLQTRHFVTVNYSRTVEEVFADAATLCIAERGDLAILSYVHLEQNADWRTASCLSVKDFEKFLRSQTAGQNSLFAQQPKLGWSNRASNYGDALVAYPVPTMYVVTSSGILALGLITDTKIPQTMSSVEVVSLQELPRQVLPCLKVRAYFIDRIQGSCVQFTGAGFFRRVRPSYSTSLLSVKIEDQ